MLISCGIFFYYRQSHSMVDLILHFKLILMINLIVKGALMMEPDTTKIAPASVSAYASEGTDQA